MENQNNVQYLKELWRDIISTEKQSSLNETLYTPYFLIDELIAEIKENNLQNEKNISFFQSQLSQFKKKDHYLLEYCRPEFGKLLLSLNNNPKDKMDYILTLCNFIKLKLDDEKYLKYNILKLADMLEETVLDIENIKYVCKSIIASFIIKGFELSYINDIISSIFSTYDEFGHDTIGTSFPFLIEGISYSDTGGFVSEKEQKEAVIDYFSNLTIKERINRISYFYSHKETALYYLFVVKGLLSNSNIDLGDILLAHSEDPQIVSSIQNRFEFRELPSSFMWARVEVKDIEKGLARKIAIDKLENTLNFITLSFSDIKNPLIVDKNKFGILNKDLEYWGGGHSVDQLSDNSTHAQYTNLNLSKDNNTSRLLDINTYFPFLVHNKNTIEQRLTNAIHYYRKGMESVKDEDALINYWISIENLFKTSHKSRTSISSEKNPQVIDIIMNITSKDIGKNFIYNSWYTSYWDFYNLLYWHPLEAIVVPKEILQKACLDSSQNRKVIIRDFIESLSKLEPYVPLKYPIIKERTIYTGNFYSDFSFFEEEVNKKIKAVQNSILMIYRCRNFIVHNAQYKNLMLHKYSNQAKYISQFIIMRFASTYEETGLEIEDLIVHKAVKNDLFFDNLKDEFTKLFR